MMVRAGAFNSSQLAPRKIDSNQHCLLIHVIVNQFLGSIEISFLDP
jgi:hypothetical protein